MSKEFLEVCYEQERELFLKLESIHSTIVRFGGLPRYTVVPTGNDARELLISDINIKAKAITIDKERSDNKKDRSWYDLTVEAIRVIGEGTAIDIAKYVQQVTGDDYESVKVNVANCASKLFLKKKVFARRFVNGRGYVYYKK